MKLIKQEMIVWKKKAFFFLCYLRKKLKRQKHYNLINGVIIILKFIKYQENNLIIMN
jgi:hypothetical protein